MKLKDSSKNLLPTQYFNVFHVKPIIWEFFEQSRTSLEVHEAFKDFLEVSLDVDDPNSSVHLVAYQNVKLGGGKRYF